MADGKSLDLDSFFDGMDDAPGQKKPFLPVAEEHIVKLVSIEAFIGRKDQRPGVRADVEVVKTTSKSTSPGMQHAIVHQQDKGRHKFWLGDTQALIAACLGVPAQKVSPATVSKALKTAKENPGAEDSIIGLEFKVTVIDDAKDGKSFKKNIYSVAPAAS